MRKLELSAWLTMQALLLVSILSACSTPPPLVEPYIEKQALAAETDGARRYARGDYVGSKLNFADAGRMYLSVDNVVAAERSQLNAARAELALGSAEAALRRVASILEPTLVTEGLSISAQAHLALGAKAAAQATIALALAACPATCPDNPSLQVLQARALLADGRAAEALILAEFGLKALQGKDELREVANVWRLIASAALATGDTLRAQQAAQTALTIDRQLGLPEKIARDWLLLGEIGQKTGAADAEAAYRRALAIAQAAGLEPVSKLANEALAKGKGVSK